METILDLKTGKISGEVTASERHIADLAGLFADEAARAALPQDTVVYRVEMHDKEKEGTPGGLLFGTSFVYPGKVGSEYFMTKGHFHAKRDTAEYYFCIAGKGALILMDEAGKCWAEPMHPGTLHYIPRSVAHRLANTGDEVLAVGCCWGADCGHDYASIAQTGFSKRLLDVNGEPQLV
ncbi:MAG: glucose-6-phosphate isomerase family protein [Candidatus Spyradocola sp.]|jgi:glucose-6-phosphate isomerase